MDSNKGVEKLSRILTAYIDLVSLSTMIGISRGIVGMIPEDLNFPVSLLLSAIISILYLVKDCFRGNSSFGKYLLGLELEETDGRKSFDVASSVVRNFPGAIFVFLFVFCNNVIFFAVFILFESVFVCFNSQRKLGDFIARSRVVYNSENRMWKNVDKSTYSICVLVLCLALLAPIFLPYFKIVLLFLSRFVFSYFWVRLDFFVFDVNSFLVIPALSLVIQCFLIRKLFDDRLPKILLLVLVLSYFSLSIFNAFVVITKTL